MDIQCSTSTLTSVIYQCSLVCNCLIPWRVMSHICRSCCTTPHICVSITVCLRRGVLLHTCVLLWENTFDISGNKCFYVHSFIWFPCVFWTNKHVWTAVHGKPSVISQATHGQIISRTSGCTSLIHKHMCHYTMQ